MPWHVVLEPDAVVFVTRFGHRHEIPYAQLHSVSSPRWSGNRQQVRWVVDGQRPVRSMTTFERWRHLLNEVQQRSPQAKID